MKEEHAILYKLDLAEKIVPTLSLVVVQFAARLFSEEKKTLRLFDIYLLAFLSRYLIISRFDSLLDKEYSLRSTKLTKYFHTMENKFTSGDVVILKSGGPIMTIIAIHDSVAICKYWDFINSAFRDDKHTLAVLKHFNDPAEVPVFGYNYKH